MSKDIATMQLQIYNRWGEKIFETNNQTIGWDGTFNGMPCAMGVYVYLLNATLTNGKTISKSGNITLVR